MQEQKKVANELRDTLKITEDLLPSNKRIDQLEERLSEQEYLRHLGDGSLSSERRIKLGQLGVTSDQITAGEACCLGSHQGTDGAPSRADGAEL